MFAALASLAIGLAGCSATERDSPPAATEYLLGSPAPRPAARAEADPLIRLANAYPVAVTGLRLPDDWIARQFADTSPATRLARVVAFGPEGGKSEADFYRWLGLPALADEAGDTTFLGANLVADANGAGLTFGCLSCHSQNFFGTVVIGMGNKASRSNALFVRAKSFFEPTPTALLAARDPAEAAMLRSTRTRLHSVGAQLPSALGLDTALAQVSLSLARRDIDADASLTPLYAAHPRTDAFDAVVADSKPIDWWIVRHKDRWLSDGSLITGDVVVTAILWNEIGRGTDLGELRQWLAANPDAVAGLRRVVDSAMPPRIEDFLVDPVDPAAARRGEAHFLATCARCHGVYRKDWSRGIRTVAVEYPQPTAVRNVGTDAGRAKGMTYLAARLNRLAISADFGLGFTVTGGYVPPPLTGIWSRYPYLHNRSIPNLCALLTPEKQRVRSYYVGTTDDIDRDFDRDCVGYPVAAAPAAWRSRDRLFDTRRAGLSNRGHPFFTTRSADEKRELIEFLKTL